jgi:hypothetical protein
VARWAEDVGVQHPGDHRSRVGPVVELSSPDSPPDEVCGPRSEKSVAMALDQSHQDVFGGFRPGLLSVGLWDSPAGLIVGTAGFALGIALFMPALMTLAVEGGIARRARRGYRHHFRLPGPGFRPGACHPWIRCGRGGS